MRLSKTSNIETVNKQPMGCETQLACKCLFTPSFIGRRFWTSKVGQSDLVFDLRSGFASRSVCARLQVSVYSGYDLCHPGCPKTDAHILTPATLKSRSKPTLLYIHVTCTHDANLVTAGPQVPEILHISIFVVA